MRVYMPRFHVGELGGNLSQMERDVAEAAEGDSDMVVFPELFLTGYRGENDLERIRHALAATSALYPGMVCVFGSLSEESRNRLIVYFQGDELVRYDKVHLFLPNNEQEFWEPGNKYIAYTDGDWRVGLATCNDVRFPEQVRALRLEHSINMMVYPALWPWARDHVWATLLRARAIENGIFVIGCCISSIDNGQERFDGAGNHVFDPLGNELYPAGRVYELDPAILQQVLVDTRSQYRDIKTVELDPQAG